MKNDNKKYFSDLLEALSVNKLLLLAPMCNTVSAIEAAQAAANNSDNKTLTITFEWQTASIHDVKSHKIIIRKKGRKQ